MNAKRFYLLIYSITLTILSLALLEMILFSVPKLSAIITMNVPMTNHWTQLMYPKLQFKAHNVLRVKFIDTSKSLSVCS